MKQSIFKLLVIAVIFSISLSIQAGDHSHHSIAEEAALNAVIDHYVDEGAYPFIYVHLEDREGHVFYEHASVNEQLMQGMGVNGKSWIRIWSMSKIVTISVLLDLVEDEMLSLSDPVTKYIPEFAGLKVAVSNSGADLSLTEDKDAACPLKLVPMKTSMTVLDLLNHRAGFYYQTTGIDCLDSLVSAAELPAAENSHELIDRMAKLPLINQPGTTHYYGTGTTVLGLVAERASGKSLKQLVSERVANPMRIEGLQYGLPPEASLPPRFSGRDGILREAQPGELDIFGSKLPDYDPAHELYLGGEGMVATADGYADFARMLLRGGELNEYRFLEMATVSDIASPHTNLDSPYGHNGYNLWVSNGSFSNGDKGPAPLWIGGGYEGTHFWIDPERGFVGVIMSQIFWVPESGWGRDEAIRKAVYEQLEGGFAFPAATPASAIKPTPTAADTL